MKKLLVIPTIILAVVFTSCESNDNAVVSDLASDLDVASEATLESNFEDVDQIVDAGMETLDEFENGRRERRAIIECAVVERDTANQIITVDYGDGCEADGKLLKGKIIITYNLRKLQPGAFREVTFEDFHVDDVKVEGTRRLENISVDLDDNPTFSITLTGGKLTFTDSTFASREASKVKTWFRGANPLRDQTHVDGEASGTRRDGISYNVDITQTLIYKRSCRAAKVFIPVQGVKEITYDGNTAIVDYGDGSCDNEVTITLNDEEPVVKTITPRGRR